MSRSHKLDLREVEVSPDGRYVRFEEKLGSGAYKEVFLASATLRQRAQRRAERTAAERCIHPLLRCVPALSATTLRRARRLRGTQ